MNKQELIKEINNLQYSLSWNIPRINKETVLELIEQLDEPQPLKLKDIISRMKQLFPLSRSEWIDEILHEFGNDFGLWKYKAGFEQGKFEGAIEPEKVKIPQFVADIIEEYKGKNAPILDIFDEKYLNERYRNWLISSLNAYDRAARAWLDGYEVEKTKEALYTVTLKSSGQKLRYHEKDEEYLFSSYNQCFLKDKYTRKELENAGFGWVFNCESMDVQECDCQEV